MRVGRRSEAIRATYACGLDAIARWYSLSSPDVLVGRVEASELEAYATLDKFVSCLDGNAATNADEGELVPHVVPSKNSILGRKFNSERTRTAQSNPSVIAG